MTMKALIKKTIPTLTLLINTSIMANTVVFNCPLNVSNLDEQFVAHWQQTPMPWHATWAHQTINHYIFVGGMRSKSNHLPIDLNPHLNFQSVEILAGRYAGELEVACVYKIQNKDMLDIDDKLFFRALIQAHHCEATSRKSARCEI